MITPVGAFIDRFETPFGMELLSTVHWVATREDAATADEAIAKVYTWSARKSMFTEEHIRVAWDALAHHGCLVHREHGR
jgi:hypothetical protein